MALENEKVLSLAMFTTSSRARHLQEDVIVIVIVIVFIKNHALIFTINNMIIMFMMKIRMMTTSVRQWAEKAQLLTSPNQPWIMSIT